MIPFVLALAALPHAVAPAAPRELPPFELQAADGPITPELLKGRWTWLYLGFANCPDICPTTLGYLADQYRRLADPAKVQVLFVSVDPARDTPATLAQYTRYFHPAFQGATGNRLALDTLAAGLGTRFEVGKPREPGGSYGVMHPNSVFVIDPKGRLVGTYAPAGDELSADFNEAPPVAVAPAASVPAWCTPPVLMERNRAMGSGTALIPAVSPMRNWAVTAEDWLWMFHGNAVLGYNFQGGPRGDLTWAAENWGMAMGTRPLGPGLLDLRLMGSAEAFTLPAGGTPQLFQAGETYRFNPLIDHQHPHDLIMELAARYTWRYDDATDLFLYGGPAGEPALGPSAFMHRPSAADNAWAPLGHHNQDSTHISYGVATAGVRRGQFQVEASAFNGREPDEDRLNLDLGPMDSLSGRLSWIPDPRWVLQVSHGHLVEPERLHPGNIERTTASIASVQATAWGPLSTQLTWGQNLEIHPALGAYPHQSYGLESQLDAWETWHCYGRLEILDRDGLPPGPPLNHDNKRIEAFTLGLCKDLGISTRFDLGLGADATVYGKDSSLDANYGYNPFAFRFYLRLRPPAMGATGTPDGMPM
ncbi:MAG: hypothetical protein JWM80_6503 [Cyanobacteria bacterium RYN_339]|nr:hypothetical protein [Cyanobacteria bacterium RYN_339]